MDRLGQSLTLPEEQKNGGVVPLGIWQRESVDNGFYMVGRILTQKHLNFDAL